MSNIKPDESRALETTPKELPRYDADEERAKVRARKLERLV